MIPNQTDLNLLRTVNNIKSTGKLKLVNSKRHTGKVVSLDESFFADKFVTMGLWQPLKFINEVPFGIFFMEEFKADKIPVLFVHGINGSPRFFEEIITNLDHDKFQPWLAYYPSGSDLDYVASYLYGLLIELDVQYDFSEIILVAHSMGGLVTRALVNIYNEKKSGFKLDRIITISTPFAGHEAAAMGLKYAPTVIPVWRDVVPESEFIRTLFLKPLAADISHYLLFSFEGKSRFAKGNNDRPSP